MEVQLDVRLLSLSERPFHKRASGEDYTQEVGEAVEKPMDL